MWWKPHLHQDMSELLKKKQGSWRTILNYKPAIFGKNGRSQALYHLTSHSKLATRKSSCPREFFSDLENPKSYIFQEERKIGNFLKPQFSHRFSTSFCCLPLHNTQKTQFSKWQTIAVYRILSKMQQKHKSIQSNLDVGKNLRRAWEVFFSGMKISERETFCNHPGFDM